MQVVSQSIINATISSSRCPSARLFVSWDRELQSLTQWWTLDQSYLDGDDILTLRDYTEDQQPEENITQTDNFYYDEETDYLIDAEGYEELNGDTYQSVVAEADLVLENSDERFTPKDELNILRNPSFERAELGWVTIGSGTSQNVGGTDVCSGTYALRIDDDAGVSGNLSIVSEEQTISNFVKEKVLVATNVDGYNTTATLRCFFTLSNGDLIFFYTINIDSNYYIRYVTSSDYGATWSNFINIISTTDVIADSQLDVCVDDFDNAHVVYGETTNKKAFYIKMSNTGRLKWTISTKVEVVDTTVSTTPSVLFDKDGILWVSYINANYIICVKKSTDFVNFSDEITLSDTGTSSYVKALLHLFNDKPMCIFTGTISGTKGLYSKEWDGSSWTNLKTISTAKYSWYHNTVTLEDKSIHVIYPQDYPSTSGVYYSYLNVGSNSWSSIIDISDGDTRPASICVTTDKTNIYVFYRTINGYTVRLYRKLDGIWNTDDGWDSDSNISNIIPSDYNIYCIRTIPFFRDYIPLIAPADTPTNRYLFSFDKDIWKTYTASVFAKGQGDLIIHTIASGTNGTLSSGVGVFSTSSGTYQRKELVYQIPAFADKLYLKFGTGQVHVLDCAQLEKESIATEFNEGFIGNKILPRRPVKIQIQMLDKPEGIGGAIPKFVGMTESFDYNIRSDYSRIHCFDYAQELRNIKAMTNSTGTGMYFNYRTDQLMTELAVLGGLTTDDYTFESGTHKVDFAWYRDGSVWYYMQQVAEAEGGRVFFDEDGNLHFWNRNHLRTNSGSQFIFTYNDWITAPDFRIDKDRIKNHIIIKSIPREEQLTQLIYQLAGVEEFAPLETKTIWCHFEDPTTSVVTPTADGLQSYYYANTQDDESGTDVTSSLSLDSISVFAQDVKMIFTNISNDTIYLTDITLFGTPVKITREIQVEEEDSSSILLYGRQTLQIENDFIDNEDYAKLLAKQRLEELKNPRNYMRIEVIGVPYLQVGDVVTVQKDEDMNFDDLYITKNRWSILQNGEFVQTLELEKKEFPAI